MNITPNQELIGYNKAIFGFRSAYYQSRSPGDIYTILGNGIVTANFVIPTSAPNFIIPSFTDKEQYNFMLAMYARAWLTVPNSIDTELYHLPCKLLSYGNVLDGINPIKINGQPLPQQFMPNDEIMHLNINPSQLYVPSVEAYISTDIFNLQSSTAFIPDLISSDWYFNIMITVKAIFDRKHGTN